MRHIIYNSPLNQISLLRDRVDNWHNYLRPVPIISQIDQTLLHGIGKSTLIEAVVDHCGFRGWEGSQNIKYGTTKDDAYSACYLSNYLRLSWVSSQKSGVNLL